MFVGDDENFRWAGEEIDSDFTEELAFGFCNEGLGQSKLELAT